jgi:hypothetical protein
MKKIVKIGDTDRRAKVDTDQDILIWDSRTGRDCTRWTQLYAHKCRGGETIFYEVYLTLWANERNSVDVVTLEEARATIEENYNDLADSMDDEALAELGLLEPEMLE